MTVKINYLNKKFNKLNSNLVLFSNENFRINNLIKYLTKSEYTYINDLLKTSDLKKKFFCFLIKLKKKKLLYFQ